jgi:hypothetical protein
MVLSVSCSKKTQNIDPKMVDASTLKISKIEARILGTPKRKVTFRVRKSATAMYSQFIICTVTKPVRCNPSEKAPGIARSDEYEFLNPPVGDLEIKLRACVEVPYAQNPEKLCGDWKRASIGTPSMI